MRLTTWNVNGIRNPFSYPPWNTARTFPAMFDILNTDIIVMQELKIQRKDLRDDMVLLEGWDAYFSLPKHKKGYSGVGIYTRNATCAPIKAEEGLLGVLPSPNGVAYCDLPEEQSIGGYPTAFQIAELGVDPAALDAEGRCLVLEFPAFVLFGVYSPANSNGQRDDFRHAFIRVLDARIRNLIRAGKNVVLVGDLNVSRDERDTANAVTECAKNGISHAEYISTPNRRIFNQLLVDGEVVGERDDDREEGLLWDTTRAFHPERKGMYTHWEQKINARPGNFGSRIDFILVSESMKDWIRDANIQEGLLGSDHCPVYADFHDKVRVGGDEAVLADLMNPPGVFENGVKKLDWKVGNVPEFSAKRMPEFDKRRSIMSMFSAGKAKEKSQPPPKLEPTMSTAEEVGSVTPSLQATSSSATTEAAGKDSTASRTNGEVKEVPSMKRKVSAPVKEKPIKRQKSEGEVQASKGQQSLKGFFSMQEKRPNGAASASPVKESNGVANDSPRSVISNGPYDTQVPSTMAMDFRATSNGTQTPPSGRSMPKGPTTPIAHPPSPTLSASASPSLSQISDQLAANEASQRSWSNLFTKPAAPMCEGHDEPCKTMQTKKKGSNQGRSFWMCARPLGPSGEKERVKGGAWRCGTFIWCSDWGGRGVKEKEKEKEGRG